MCELCERKHQEVVHGLICLSCADVYCADDSEPFFHTDQCPDCWDDKSGECYSRNART